MWYALSFFIAAASFAGTLELKSGEGTYTVKHLVKRVEGTSKELKGKMICEKGSCEFLLAAPVKSFTSSDSNRDLNMQDVVDAATYPLVTAKGSMSEELLAKGGTIDALVSFHGVEKKYPVILGKNGTSAKLVLKLDQHKVERPSLFTVKIDDEVPVTFQLSWKQN